MENYAIKIQGVKKQYRLGQIGGGTLTADLQSWWARVRGKEDPNIKLDQDQRLIGQTFMALNGIDLTIYQGEAVGIIGRNGAGKSTLLKLLSRVTAPTAGTIDINGRIASMLEVGTGFSPEMTGKENVYLNGTILGMTKAEVDAKMDKIIEFSEIGEFIDTPVKRYSSGMYVKLAFSVAAHLDSEIMIMDEVLAVGDMAFQRKCLDKMREAANNEGRTVLYVSHNMNTIRQLCDRCVVLDQGRVIFEGEVEEAINEYLGCGYTKFDIAAERTVNETTQEVQITSVDLHGKNIFNFGEDIRIDMEFESHKVIDSLYFRFCINLPDGTPIATSTTKPIKAKLGMNSSSYLLDVANLAPAKYVIKILAIEISDFGTQERHDRINRAVGFEITSVGQLHNFIWDTKYWGHYVIPDAEVITED